MEVGKFLENTKLTRKERELNYWSSNYDHAFQNLDISTLINEQVISNNKRSTNKFKEKYPFYNDLLLLVITESDMAIRKTKIVQFIISYLDIINENGNIQVKKFTYLRYLLILIKHLKYSTIF